MPVTSRISMNKQNPDRGIETLLTHTYPPSPTGMNKQNPDRGIETLRSSKDISNLP